jgi:hypothetical protein
MTERAWQDNGENYIIKSFIMLILKKYSYGVQITGEIDGRGT